MARTISQDYDKKKQIILSKSVEAFATTGYHNTPLDMIAGKCKMSKSLIYHYFDSKNEILFACMKGYVERLVDVTVEIEGQKLSPEKTLKTILARFLNIYEESHTYQIVLLNELKNLTKNQRDIVVNRQDHLVHIFGKIIRNINPTIARRKGVETVLTMMLFGTINWTYTWFKSDGAITAEQFAEIVYQNFTIGICNVKF